MIRRLPLRTLVADDHRLFRQGLISLMNTRPDLIQVIGEAESGSEAIDLAEKLSPDLILLDIYMPQQNGLQAAEVILTNVPHTAIVMLTASELDEHLDQAVRLGVSGYLLKNLDAKELFDLVEGVSRGEVAVTRALASRMLRNLSVRKSKDQEPVDDLTDREIEVLRLVARGASNPQIARELHVTVNTVKAHLKKILDKLNVENRTQAAAYAMRSGLVMDETKN
jgi:DNA-binding NarL/FixJ family response regulator